MHVHASNAGRKSIKSPVHPRHSVPASRHGKQPPPSTPLLRVSPSLFLSPSGFFSFSFSSLPGTSLSLSFALEYLSNGPANLKTISKGFTAPSSPPLLLLRVEHFAYEGVLFTVRSRSAVAIEKLSTKCWPYETKMR